MSAKPDCFNLPKDRFLVLLHIIKTGSFGIAWIFLPFLIYLHILGIKIIQKSQFWNGVFICYFVSLCKKHLKNGSSKRSCISFKILFFILARTLFSIPCMRIMNLVQEHIKHLHAFRCMNNMLVYFNSFILH